LFGFTAEHFPTVIERYIVRFHPYHLPDGSVHDGSVHDGSVHDVSVVLSYHTIFGIEGLIKTSKKPH